MKLRPRRWSLILGIVCILLPIARPASAQRPRTEQELGRAEDLRVYIRANYTKNDYMVPMRDGVRLFVSVYSPKDTSRRYPILLMRTPYRVAPYGEDSYPVALVPSEYFAHEGYIFAYCDVRGKGKSEGQWEDIRPFIPNKTGKQTDEASDAYDTIDFLLKTVPNNNGRVGAWGISYNGFYATMTILSGHPALKAASPQAPVTEWFLGDDWRHNGAFMVAHAFGFLAGFGRPKLGENEIAGPGFDYGTPDAYDFYLRMGPLANADKLYFKGKIDYWNELVTHDTYTDYWKSRDPLPYLKNVKAAVMTVGGWFDAEDFYGAIHTAYAMREQNPGTVSMLVAGPWSHGQWNRDAGESLGDVHFNQHTAEYFREHIEFPFFQYYLKGEGTGNFPGAYVFETGTNQWRTFERWPPPAATSQTYYLESAGGLDTTPPTSSSGFDEYASDPAKPVPYTLQTSQNMVAAYMTGDQRFAGRRTDVLVYQTEPLTHDVTFAGPLKASLYVSTTGTDSDFIVKLIDVYPGNFPDPDSNPSGVKMGGYQQLVRGEPMRGKFRNSFEHPEPFEPGKPTKVEFQLPDVFQTFRRGHRIMVQVQSSWFPLFDRNPQKFIKIDEAQESDFQKATERVYHSAKLPSSLTVEVLPAAVAASER